MKLRMCEIVQQLEYIDLDYIEKVLNEKVCIKDWAYIIHGKDTNEKGDLKSPHIHLALRFKDSYDTKHISQWFNVGEQYVSKVKGRWNDVLKYLTHANAPDKYQYDVDEVVSNFEFKSAIISKSERKEEIINKIVDGEIREYNYYDYITPVEHDNFKKSIDNAFSYRKDKLRGAKRNMDCIFITGDSGSGKTTMAKDMATEKGYSYYVSSGSNDVLDDYKGEDCIILDDLRPSCMGLSDLLKMLDNNTASTVKSRYKNKVLECKLIIITTVLPLEEFFSHVFDNEKEPIVQLKRRCKTYIKLTRENMTVGMWLVESQRYRWLPSVPNPVLDKYVVKDKSDDELLEDILALGSFFTGVADTFKKNKMSFDEEDGDSPF